MKIEIDLNEILVSEDGIGNETWENGVRRLVVNKLAEDFRSSISRSVDEKISALLDDQIAEAIQKYMPGIIDDIVNSSYTPVSSFGQRGEPTTFREELVKAIVSNLVYKKCRFSSDENMFTKAVNSIIEAKTQAVTKEIVARVDGDFAREALRVATTTLAKRLGIKAESLGSLSENPGAPGGR